MDHVDIAVGVHLPTDSNVESDGGVVDWRSGLSCGRIEDPAVDESVDGVVEDRP